MRLPIKRGRLVGHLAVGIEDAIDTSAVIEFADIENSSVAAPNYHGAVPEAVLLATLAVADTIRANGPAWSVRDTINIILLDPIDRPVMVNPQAGEVGWRLFRSILDATIRSSSV